MRPFWVGVLAGYGIAMPVGGISVLIVQVGMRCGFRCAASAGAGAASADMLYATLAVTAGAVLAGWVEVARTPLRLVSAAVLVAIAVVGLARARHGPPVPDATPPSPGEYARTYGRFLGLTVVNPLTVVYFAAFVVGLGVAANLPPAQAAAFVVGAFLASLSWQTLLAGVGAAARRALPRRFHVVTIVVGNLVILAMAGYVALG